ncbi:uncharacterized protein LOC120429094 [Culex pipiens pallens]|uniref:uncharacterized protein LOC120429094 n=1 Tax=Culex pipiens pallens TaxID=42434 RepID=UPI0019549683|nr:uncharacterized protein LOC120429094 [Culex pipiens pallens]
MPRVYKRVPGSRAYRDYEDDNLQKCLKAIARGMTHREASEAYGIPKSTIGNKLYTDRNKDVGGQRVFTDEEERAFVRCLVTMAEFGFPVNEDDLRYVVKHYLTKVGRNVERFQENFPGRDWTKSFLSRHPDLSVRFVANIKKSRAKITAEILTEYINNLLEVAVGVPPENFWNFDESNVTDDPGSRKCIVKRGVKYPANIMDTSKSSISIMMAGSAAGEVLPPYVVYKYNNSTSGWFDTAIFEDWFEFHLLPTLKKRSGKKVVIGDNVSSHFSPRVLELCQMHNICFVCLPPNSTHITQPLDVAFFGPMKKHWRQILRSYKEKSSNSATSLQKPHFPGLLNQLMEAIKPNQKHNMKAGFKKCGIFPTSVEPLLKSVSCVPSSPDLIEDSFKDFLNAKRTAVVGGAPTKRRKKFDIPAGTSVTAEDLARISNQENGQRKKPTEKPPKKPAVKPTKKPVTRRVLKEN